MTSTLPNFLVGLAAAPTVSSPPNAAASAATTVGGEGPVPPPADFSSLMPAASSATLPLITVSPLLPAQPPVVMPATPALTAQPVVASQVSLGAAAMAAPNGRFTVMPSASRPVKPLESDPAANAATIQIPSWSRGALVPDSTPTGARAPRLPLTDASIPFAEVPEEIREQAAAFAAALMQTLLPPTAPAPATEGAAEAVTAGATDISGPVLSEETTVVTTPTSATPQGSPWNQSGLTLPNGRAFPTNLPDQASPSLGSDRSAPGALSLPIAPTDEVLPEPVATPLTLPNGREFPAELPTQAQPSLAANRAVPEKLPAQARPIIPADRPVPAETAVGPEMSPEVSVVPAEENAAVTSKEFEPVFTVAADGTIELKLCLPATRETDLNADAQPEPVLEVSAELELPGQAVIRIEATVPEAHGFHEAARPVNFAGLKAAEKSSGGLPVNSSERNFVFAGDKQVKAASAESGIAIAKTENKMSVAPTEEIRTTRNPETLSVLPPRAEFQVVQSPAERITVAPTEPAGQTFAERAVATVTGLAEAQFSASMHKAGSVQLRLKFGGEDLSVRVELRDGAVHTDFRTDSPELREALAREWQAVAASSPGHLQRFLDPVFSPASAPASTEAGTQQQASYRQTPQQQAQEQAANRQDAWHSQSPFSRRSALSESFVPEPAASRVPVLLPTSLRLSALA